MAQKAPAKKTAKKTVPKRPAPPAKINGSEKKLAKRPAEAHPKTEKLPVKKEIAVAAAPKEKKEKVIPLSKSDLHYFRNLLLEKRREILGDVGSMESEAFKAGSNLSNMPIHMADVGTDNFEQEFTLGLIETERQTLREIQEALRRIEDGTYGICQGTGKQIPRVRLEAMPWAKYTIEYKRLMDQGKIEDENASASDDDDSEEDEE